MVLQRGMEVPVWGNGKPCSEIVVEFAGQVKKGKVDEEGKWMVRMAPFEGYARGRMMTVRDGAAEIQLSDVVVGEVWICSGQSNMQMGRGGVPALQGLSEDNLRTFEVKRTVAFTEQEELAGDWKIGGPGLRSRQLWTRGSGAGRTMSLCDGIPIFCTMR